MRNQEGFEGIIQVGYHLEVVEGDEGTQLHVLNQGPHGQETEVLEEKEEVLNDNNSNEVPISFDSKLSPVIHPFISEIKLKINSFTHINFLSVCGVKLVFSESIFSVKLAFLGPNSGL